MGSRNLLTCNPPAGDNLYDRNLLRKASKSPQSNTSVSVKSGEFAGHQFIQRLSFLYPLEMLFRYLLTYGSNDGKFL